jgi:hypothetical protein
MILCADSRMTDALGMQPGELVGRAFSNLCTDVEGVNKYLTAASQAIEGAVINGQPSEVPTFKTKVQCKQQPAAILSGWQHAASDHSPGQGKAVSHSYARSASALSNQDNTD